MPQEALFHDPDLVRIIPVSPARHVRGGEDFDLGSELMVGHKVGLSTDAEIPSDGLRRKDTFHRALAEQRTVDILSMLFDRLYVLRNQLIHGGATWNSRVNRDQLRDGVAILSVLMPVMIDIMMDNADEEWGRPFYPVVEG